MPTNLHTFLRTRRSIRRFKPDAIPNSVLTEIIATAGFAPSAHNRQPWRFCVVTDPALRDHLADEMSGAFRRDLLAEAMPEDEIQKRVARSRERIASAPAIIILCLDINDADLKSRGSEEIEHLMAVQSVANAGMQLLLAVHAEGLGGVWIGSPLYAQETVQAALSLPDAWKPQAMFLIGYPAEHPEVRARKPLLEIIQWNQNK